MNSSKIDARDSFASSYWSQQQATSKQQQVLSKQASNKDVEKQATQADNMTKV